MCSPPFLVIVPRGGGGDHVILELGPAVPKLPVRMRAVLGKQRVPVKNPVPRPQQPYDRQILHRVERFLPEGEVCNVAVMA